MLYITTRNNIETYASRYTLKENIAPDGGQFVPCDLPVWNSDHLMKFKDMNFGAVVAEVINVFYPNKLSGWDVDFCIGRNILRLVPMNQKIVVAELWHNLEEEYAYIVRDMSEGDFKTLISKVENVISIIRIKK